MKSLFLIGILLLTTSIALAQMGRVVESNTTIAVGVNLIDNNNHGNGSGVLPFIGGKLDFKTPLSVIVEHRFDLDFSASLSLTTNKLGVGVGSQSYYAIDAMGQFYFDHYIFNSESIEMYAGLGLGHYEFENRGSNTFNVLGGARYWFSDHYGINTQLIAKSGLKPVNVAIRDNYQMNLGVIWRN